MLNLYNQQNNRTVKDSFPTASDSSAKKPNFLNYIDTSGSFGSKKLQRGLWFLRHEVSLYWWLVGFLIAVSIGLWVFSLWSWGSYLIFGITADNNLYQRLRIFPNYSLSAARYSPQPINILETEIFQSGVEKYDVIGTVNNSNSRFFVQFDYFFTVDGVAMPTRKGFLLPGETKPLAEFGLSASPSGATLTLQNLDWQRISSKKVANIDSWQSERLNFGTEKFTFVRPESAVGANAYSIQFTLVNNSPYGYAYPNFYVGLLYGDQLVGVMPLKLQQLESGEKQLIDIRSFSPNLNVTDVKIFPIINLYDGESYLQPPK